MTRADCSVAGLDEPELELLLWMREHTAGTLASLTTRDVGLATRWSASAAAMMLARLEAAGLVRRIGHWTMDDVRCRWRAESRLRDFERLLSRDPVAAYDAMAGREHAGHEFVCGLGRGGFTCATLRPRHGDAVRFEGILPSGIARDTPYYVVEVSCDEYGRRGFDVSSHPYGQVVRCTTPGRGRAYLVP